MSVNGFNICVFVCLPYTCMWGGTMVGTRKAASTNTLLALTYIQTLAHSPITHAPQGVNKPFPTDASLPIKQLHLRPLPIPSVTFITSITFNPYQPSHNTFPQLLTALSGTTSMDELGKHNEPKGASGLSGNANKVDEVVPWPGKTFIIREKDIQRMLTLWGGKLEICSTASARGCFHWDCTEQNGWLGFRNTVSGTYISFIRHLNYSVGTSQSFSQLTARRHPDGGYNLMANDGESLFKITLNPKKGLVWVEDIGTRWEFVRASDF